MTQAATSGLMLKLRQLEGRAQEATAAKASADGTSAELRRERDEHARVVARQREAVAAAEAVAREQQARIAELEGALSARDVDLTEAKGLCFAAREECVRVRRKNEQLERVVERLQAAGPAPAQRQAGLAVGDVMNDLEQMELMVRRDRPPAGQP